MSKFGDSWLHVGDINGSNSDTDLIDYLGDRVWLKGPLILVLPNILRVGNQSCSGR